MHLATYRPLVLVAVFVLSSASALAADAPKSSLFGKLSAEQRAAYENAAVRLWEGDAPEAKGSTAADVPMLYPVLPPRGAKPVGAILVFPGGGYRVHAAHEGFPIAEHFRAAGFAAFVVSYRLLPYRNDTSLADAQRAVRLLRHRAGEFGIDPERIAAIGFSAGGHLTAAVSNHGDDGLPEAKDPIDRQSSRLQSALLIYPWLVYEQVLRQTPAQRALPPLLKLQGTHDDVTERTPPTFMVVGYDDPVTPREHCLVYTARLHQVGVRHELHVFGVGEHGFGMRSPLPSLKSWPQLATSWLLSCGFPAAELQ